MKDQESQDRDQYQDTTDIPDPVWIVIIHDQTGTNRANHLRDGPGQAVGGHVASAHVFGGKVGNQCLPDRDHDHLAKRDDEDGSTIHPQSVDKSEHRKPDHVEKRAQRHHLHGRVVLYLMRYRELGEDDQNCTYTEQHPIVLRCEAAMIDHEYRERAVHLRIHQQHEYRHKDEGKKEFVFEDGEITKHCFAKGFLLDRKSVV